MHVHLRRQPRSVLPVLGIVALLAVCCSGGAALAAGNSSTSLAGKWSGKYSGAFSGTFTLHWKQSGSRLSGSIKLSRPSGTYPVTGTLRGTAVKFGAVGAGATYTGAVHGNSMSGRYKTGQGGGSWSAHKAS
jgi:hypothetical protein